MPSVDPAPALGSLRRVAGLTFRLAWPRTALVGLAATTLAVAAAWATPAEPDARYQPASLWLHLALLPVALAGVAATVEAWPGFGSDQPGRGALLRLRTGWLDGLPAAALGGLLAIVPALFVASIAFELLDRRDTDRALAERALPIPASARAVLHAGQPELRFALPPAQGGRPWNRLELRPRAVVAAKDAALYPAQVTILWDDAPIAGPLEFTLTGDLAAVEIPPPPPGTAPRGPTELVLRRAPGPGVALAFEAETLAAFRPAPGRPPWQALLAAGSAGLLAAASALVGLAAAVLVAGLGGSRGVTLAAGATLAVLSGPIGLSPHSLAIEALAADHWISAELVAEGVTGSLSAALLAMLAAGLPRLARVR